MHLAYTKTTEGPSPSWPTSGETKSFSEKFLRDAHSASLSVVGVTTRERELRKRVEPKNFLAADFFNERVGVRAVSIQ